MRRSLPMHYQTGGKRFPAGLTLIVLVPFIAAASDFLQW